MLPPLSPVCVCVARLMPDPVTSPVASILPLTVRLPSITTSPDFTVSVVPPDCSTPAFSEQAFCIAGLPVFLRLGIATALLRSKLSSVSVSFPYSQ